MPAAFWFATLQYDVIKYIFVRAFLRSFLVVVEKLVDIYLCSVHR